MELNYTDLPDVNDYIKLNKLTPTDIELEVGSSYNDNLDRTYLVVVNKQKYASYSCMICAMTHAFSGNELVICKGEIK